MGFYPDWANPTFKIVRLLVLVFAVTMIWPYLPRSDSPAFRVQVGDRAEISDTVGDAIYDVPWRRVHELLIGAGRKTDGILSDPTPFVLQTSPDDFFGTYEPNGYTDRPR